MKKYRKKPVVIEAVQWWKTPGHPKVCEYNRTHTFIRTLSCVMCKVVFTDHGWVDTLEGGHIVCPGDWIIKGVEGEYYPCKPKIFEKTYEKVDGE